MDEKRLFTHDLSLKNIKLKDENRIVVWYYCQDVKVLGLKSFIESCARVAKLIGKPDSKELSASIKINLIGLAILGVLGFIIKFLAFQFGAAAPTY